MCVLYNAEWEALYTTQITQKSKKYHVGILRLASSGSFRNKVDHIYLEVPAIGVSFISINQLSN